MGSVGVAEWNDFGTDPTMLDAVSVPEPLSEASRTSSRSIRKACDRYRDEFHLLVASVDTTLGTFSIDQAEKSTTRLGERDPDTGQLSAAAMQRGFDTLRRFCDLATSHSVEQIVTAATSTRGPEWP